MNQRHHHALSWMTLLTMATLVMGCGPSAQEIEACKKARQSSSTKWSSLAKALDQESKSHTVPVERQEAAERMAKMAREGAKNITDPAMRKTLEARLGRQDTVVETRLAYTKALSKASKLTQNLADGLNNKGMLASGKLADEADKAFDDVQKTGEAYMEAQRALQPSPNAFVAQVPPFELGTLRSQAVMEDLKVSEACLELELSQSP